MVEVAESNLNAVAETDPGYGQLFAILIRRRYWLLVVVCLAMSIATIKALREKSSYQSSMQLLVEPNYQGKDGAGAEKFADSHVEIDNATQLSLMQSTQLIAKAVDLLKPEYADISVSEIKSSLVVSQLQDKGSNKATKIFQVTYTDDNPVKSQKVLKAIQKVYQDYNREQQKQRLTRGLSFIEEQIPKVSESVSQSEAALEQFRKSQNLIEPESQASRLSTVLAGIVNERQTIRVQSKELEARCTALQQALNRSPQDALISLRLSQSSRYQVLLNEIQRTELAIAQQRLRFTDQSPVIQQLLEQRQSQLVLLQQEARRVLGGDSTQPNGTEESLLKKGQLSTVDLTLSNQLLDAQTNLLALRARDGILAQMEEQVRGELQRFPSLLAQYNRLQPQIQLKRETLQQLLKARQELSLEIARGGFDWQVVEEPQLGLENPPKTKQTLLLGVVVGLMLGGVAAFVREMVDDAIHSSDELKKQVDLPLLGMTPELPQAKASEPIIKLPFHKPQDHLASWGIPVVDWPPFRESLDLIYQNIQLLNSASTFKSLMITSALAGEGKSTLALGLAATAARLHQRVLLIDADLRRPSLHKMLNLPNEQGLSTLLVSDTSVPIQNSIQFSSSYNNISILTSGPTPADPARLLSSQQMKQLIAAFEQTYDIVILDAPPILGIVDAILAGSFCSGVVLVGRIDRVTRTELTQATAMLSKLNVIGVVANGASGHTYGYIPSKKQQGLSLQHMLQQSMER